MGTYISKKNNNKSNKVTKNKAMNHPLRMGEIPAKMLTPKLQTTFGWGS